jgi:glycosyltransferase involved in cell wall biosynthesis
MRLLEVSYLHPKDQKAGGLERFVSDLSKYFSKYYDVTIVYMTNIKKNSTKETKMNVSYFPIYINRLLIPKKLFYNIKLRNINRNGIFNLIHINGDNGGILAKKDHKALKIMTIHGNSLQAYNSIKQKLFFIPRLKQFISMLIGYDLEVKGITYSNLVTAVSKRTGDSFGMNDRIKTIYNFSSFYSKYMDKEESRKKLHFDQNEVYAIWVGRDRIRKGLDIAIESVLKTKKIKLLVCGISGKSTDRIIFFDNVNDEILLDLLNSSDIFLFPSVYEAFSMAILEALQIGLTVIISDKIGNAEVLENEKTAYLASNDDQFAKYLLNIEQDKTKIFDRAYISNIFKDYSIEKVGNKFKEMIDLYSK